MQICLKHLQDVKHSDLRLFTGKFQVEAEQVCENRAGLHLVLTVVRRILVPSQVLLDVQCTA